jgi:hypothetical protein
MKWMTRTLDELRVVEPRQHYDGKDLVVHVNREEALLLHGAGATVVSSGCRFSEGRGTQRYEFQGKIYFWLSGYGSALPDDEYPVGDEVDSRVLEALNMSRKCG